MLLFILGDVILTLDNLALELVDLLALALYFGICVIQVSLHVTTGGDGLLRQPLLSSELILQVVALVHEASVLLLELPHLGDCVLLVMLVLLALNGLGTEHPRKEFSVVLDLLQLIEYLFLELPRLFELRVVAILVLADFFFQFFDLLTLLNFLIAQRFDQLLVLIDANFGHLKFGVQLLHLGLRIHLILLIIISLLVIELLHKCFVLIFQLGVLLVDELELIS